MADTAAATLVTAAVERATALASLRVETKAEAIATIRRLEVAVMDLASRYRLHAPNLASSNAPLNAFNVRGGKLDEPLPWPTRRGPDQWGRRVLVMHHSGRLGWGRRGDGVTNFSDVADEDLLLEDVVAVAETVQKAFAWHCERVDAIAEGVDDYRWFASELGQLLGRMERR